MRAFLLFLFEVTCWFSISSLYNILLPLPVAIFSLSADRLFMYLKYLYATFQNIMLLPVYQVQILRLGPFSDSH